LGSISEVDMRNIMRSEDHPEAGIIDLNNGPLYFTTNISDTYARYTLETVSIQASAPISETITVTIDRNRGSAYDTIIFKKTLSSNQSIELQFNGRRLERGDEIKISSTSDSIGSSKISLYCIVMFGYGK